jgi:hypothetical protein
MDDLFVWNVALRGGRIVNESSFHSMAAATSLNDGRKVGYGFGLFTGSTPIGRVIRSATTDASTGFGSRRGTGRKKCSFVEMRKASSVVREKPSHPFTASTFLEHEPKSPESC